MAEVIVVTNQKGGVGKSTTVLTVGAYLIQQGKKVLYIDSDAQGNLSYCVGADASKGSLMDLLMQTKTAEEVIQHTPNGDIISSASSLANADIMIVSTGKEYRLKEAIQSITGAYDYILIDTPPTLNIATVNALTCCHSVVVPVQADIFSLQGLGQLIQTINTIKKYTNKDIIIKGLLVTRYNARAVITKEVLALLQSIAEEYELNIFKAKIRECTAIKEAQAMKSNIFTYAPKSNAVADYTAFIEELINY